MTIKEIEKLTGLTSKSIRYYESKDLIAVDRQKDNNYRDYTEENLNQLKMIKLYRYLDFSIEEIKILMFAEKQDKTELICRKQEQLAETSEDIQDKQSMLSDLSKDIKNEDGNFDKYLKEIEFWESSDGAEAKESLRRLLYPSLSSAIYQTLICLAPILSLFIKIAQGDTASLFGNAVLAVATTVYLTLFWHNYAKTRRYQKLQTKKISKEETKSYILEAVASIAAIIAAIACSVLVAKLLAPNNWLFYIQNPTAINIMVIANIFAVFAIILLIIYQKENAGKISKKALTTIVLCIAVIWAASIYCSSTSITFVTEDKIIVHSPLDPSGTEYSYDDISKVDAKFGDKTFAFTEHKKKGQFSYTITLNGKEIVISTSTAVCNEDIQRYAENTYLNIEEFDQKIMELGIEKQSNSEYSDYCNLNKDIVDRVLRIINNR